MVTAQITKFPISAHAWSGDFSQITFSPNNNSVIVSKKVGNKYVEQSQLQDHSARVLSIDWCPKNNLILTGSEDCGAYVWKLDGGNWKPQMVILNTKHAAHCAQWSPNGNKFAVGTVGQVCVCIFDQDQNWWVKTKTLDKCYFGSSITCIAWHPNNCFIACCGTDSIIRVCNGFVKSEENDNKPNKKNAWVPEDIKSSSKVLRQISPGTGWVNSVCFSPSGNILGAVTQGSAVAYYDATVDTDNVGRHLFTRYLPFVCCLWLSESTFVAAGHDHEVQVVVFKYTKENGMKQVGTFAVRDQKPSDDDHMSAKIRFQRIDKTGTSESAASTNSEGHCNTIKEMRPTRRDSAGNVTAFSTVGGDGRLVLYETKSLEERFRELKL